MCHSVVRAAGDTSPALPRRQCASTRARTMSSDVPALSAHESRTEPAAPHAASHSDSTNRGGNSGHHPSGGNKLDGTGTGATPNPTATFAAPDPTPGTNPALVLPAAADADAAAAAARSWATGQTPGTANYHGGGSSGVTSKDNNGGDGADLNNEPTNTWGWALALAASAATPPPANSPAGFHSRIFVHGPQRTLTPGRARAAHISRHFVQRALNPGSSLEVSGTL